MANQNGRNVAVPDENRPSWRPQDEAGQRNRRSMSDDDDRYMSRDDRYMSRDDRYMPREDRYMSRDDRFMTRDRDDDRFMRNWDDRSSRWDRDEGYRSTERYGQGQSGYGAGRYEDDRGFQSRNMGYPSHMEERARERGLDERFSQGRGGSRWADPYEGRGGPSGYGGYLGQGGQQTGYGNPGNWSQRGMPQGYGQQSHRGKGPAGYMRSDERVREMVCEALTEDHNIDASNIEVTVKSGEVVLTGTVEDRQQKRMAEDCVEQVAGVKDVQNQIRIATDRRTGKESSYGSQASTKETEASSSASTSDKRHRA